MALNLSDVNSIEVISSKDEAVQCEPESYALYLETLDESLLNLDSKISPTRFVLKKSMRYDEAKNVKNQQVGYKNGEVTVQLGFMMDVVRSCLIDIKNPGSGLEFKKDGDGKASKDLIEKLDLYGISQELFIARQNSLTSIQGATKKNLPHSLNSPSQITQL
jgi:hypothetical protein